MITVIFFFFTSCTNRNTIKK